MSETSTKLCVACKSQIHSEASICPTCKTNQNPQAEAQASAGAGCGTWIAAIIITTALGALFYYVINPLVYGI
jgi:predicted amidophosphoribosyltransferase